MLFTANAHICNIIGRHPHDSRTRMDGMAREIVSDVGLEVINEHVDN